MRDQQGEGVLPKASPTAIEREDNVVQPCFDGTCVTNELIAMRTPFLSVSFLILGISTLVLAVVLGRVAALGLGWLGLSFFVLGVAYLRGPTLALLKNSVSGRLALSMRLLLLPYLILTLGLWHLMRILSREPAHCLVSTGIHIGRRLLPFEYPSGIRTIVDLTAEFDEVRPPGQGYRYHNVPLLDGAALPPEDLRELAAKIATFERPIYIHCAQGHGRTAMVAAALLLVLGHVVSPSQALEQIAACRPGARPNGTQRRCVLALEAA